MPSLKPMTIIPSSRIYPSLLGIASVVGVWVGLYFLIGSSILPSPWAVVGHLPSLWEQTPIAQHLLASLGRIGWGIGISLIVALLLGWAMYCSPRTSKAIEAFTYLSYPIPKLALLPVVMLLMGLGEATKVMMIVLIILFQLVVGIHDASRGIPDEQTLLFRSLGASRLACMRHLWFPAILPGVFSSLRVATGTAISVLFVTETYGTSLGMGYYITEAWMRVHYLDMYASILLLALLGALLFALLNLAQALLCPHLQSSRS